MKIDKDCRLTQVRIRKAGLGALLGSLSLTAFSTAAAAQDAPATAPAAQDAGTQAASANGASDSQDVEDIVVFGRKRPETVFRSPEAVTALAPLQLTQQSISQLTDLSRVAPNVIVRQSTGGSGDIQVVIRGQIIAVSNPSNDAPIGIYFDDAYVAEGKGLTGSVFDLDSVEVSRGVQGTLSGRNNTGGAIRFYTAKPVLGETSATLSGSYGTHDLHRESAVVNLPIGDTLAVRFGFQDSYRGPIGHSTVTGAPVNTINQQLFRGSLKWAPSDQFSTTIVYEHSQANQAPPGFNSPLGGAIAAAVISCTRGSTNVSGACYPASVVAPSNLLNTSTADPIGKDRVRSDFVRGTLDYKLSDVFDFKTTVAYRSLSAITEDFDVDYTPALQTLSTAFGSTSKQFTVEPQLTAHLLDSRLTLVGGYFHFFDDAAQPSTARSGALVGSSYGFNISTIYDIIKNRSEAGYLHGEFAVTPRWTIAGGARYTMDDRFIQPNSYTNNADPRSQNYQKYLAGTVPGQVCTLTHLVNSVSTAYTGTGPCPIVSRDETFHYWSYEFSTRYELSDGLAIYARTGRGQKSGGLTSPLRNVSADIYLPEQVTDYEAGLKANHLLSGLLSFNLALYYSDYKNMQRYTSSVQSSGIIASQVFNVGSARIQGAEFDFSLHPTQQLTLTGFAGYTDAKYKQFDVTNAAGQVFDLSAQTFYATPKLTSRLAFIYEVPVSNDGKVTIGGGWNHQSSQSLYLFTYDQFVQKAYDTFDARVTYSPSQRFDISVWGTNLLDKNYFQAASVSPVNAFDPSQGFNSGGRIAGESRIIAATLTVHL